MGTRSAENDGAGLASLLAGLGLGALIAILLAPRSGEETRDLIAESAKEGRDVVLEAVGDLKDQVGTVVQSARKKVETAVEIGKETYLREIAQQQSQM